MLEHSLQWMIFPSRFWGSLKLWRRMPLSRRLNGSWIETTQGLGWGWGWGSVVECKQEDSGPNPRTAKEKEKKKQQDVLMHSPLTEQVSGPGPRTNEIQPRCLLTRLCLNLRASVNLHQIYEKKRNEKRNTFSRDYDFWLPWLENL